MNKPPTPKPRTSSQNNALHLGCHLIAEALNDSGKDMRTVLKPEISIPWTTKSVKEYIFKPVMKLMTLKDSTTKLNKIGEIDEVWETAMRYLMEHGHLGEYIPFPHDEDKVKIELGRRNLI